jgi:hypothetical protein
MRPRIQQPDDQTRLTTYEHIIQCYLRYVLIRTAAYTNDKEQAQRIAIYALVTACLLFDKLQHLGELGSLVEMMVKIAGEDLIAHSPANGEDGARPVFVLDDRMCEVAGAVNGLDPFARELLILHHVERLKFATLADLHGLSVDEVREASAEAEGQFVGLLRDVSGWDRQTTPDVHTLLAELAACIDQPWSAALGLFALRYAAEWRQ